MRPDKTSREVRLWSWTDSGVEQASANLNKRLSIWKFKLAVQVWSKLKLLMTCHLYWNRRTRLTKDWLWGYIVVPSKKEGCTQQETKQSLERTRVATRAHHRASTLLHRHLPLEFNKLQTFVERPPAHLLPFSCAMEFRKLIHFYSNKQCLHSTSF